MQCISPWFTMLCRTCLGSSRLFASKKHVPLIHKSSIRLGLHLIRCGKSKWMVPGCPRHVHALKLTVRTWKMVGRLLSFWGGLFSGAMLVLGRVPFIFPVIINAQTSSWACRVRTNSACAACRFFRIESKASSGWFGTQTSWWTWCSWGESHDRTWY